MENKIMKKKYSRRIERAYWIVVILTDDWNKDDAILKLVERNLTKFALISKPVYHRKYDKCVRYATFSWKRICV